MHCSFPTLYPTISFSLSIDSLYYRPNSRLPQVQDLIDYENTNGETPHASNTLEPLPCSSSKDRSAEHVPNKCKTSPHNGSVPLSDWEEKYLQSSETFESLCPELF